MPYRACAVPVDRGLGLFRPVTGYSVVAHSAAGVADPPAMTVAISWPQNLTSKMVVVGGEGNREYLTILMDI